MAMDLVKLEERTAALSSYGTSDLSDAVSVTALIRTAKEVNDQTKALKEQDTRVKDEFKRMCKPYTDEGHGVTCYSFDDGLKMTLTVSGGGLDIDEDALLRQLYDAYGEIYGDKGGKAWRAFCAVSDPIDVPRKLNEQKLAEEVARAKRIASGVEAGEVMVTDEMVMSVAVEKKPVLSAKCSAMTKAEKKAYDMGELTDVLKVG